MADKEEVEPAEEPRAAEPSDAADFDTASARSAQSDGAEVTDDAEPDADEFDQIVRGSGLGGSHAVGANGDRANGERDADEKALEPAGVGVAARGANAKTMAQRRSARKAKEVATKRRDQPVKTERTGPVKFVQESVGELRKVVYPTGQQLINYFVVVLVFVLFIIAFVSLLDLAFGAAIFKIFS